MIRETILIKIISQVISKIIYKLPLNRLDIQKDFFVQFVDIGQNINARDAG